MGAILIDGEAISKIIDTLGHKDFFVDDNAVIYKAMVELYERGETIDQITVGSELGKLGKPGLIAYLSHLVANCPTSLHITHYAEIVRRCSFYRQLLGMSSQIAKIATEQSLSIEDALDECENLIQDLRQKTAIRSRRLVLGKPRLIQTNPPRYIWNVNGKDLRLTLSEITIWGKFKNRVIAELGFVPIKPKDWDNTIDALLAHSQAMEAPADASEEQQLKIFIQRWFERMREATVHSDLSVGRHIIREVRGISYYFFKSTPLLNYLKKEYKRSFSSEDLWVFVEKWGGIRHKIRVKTPTGSTPCGLWGIPIDFADEAEKQEEAPDWF